MKEWGMNWIHLAWDRDHWQALVNSNKPNVIFKIQKRIIRTMTKSRSRDSCRHLFKQLGILQLQSQYIFSVLLFMVKK